MSRWLLRCFILLVLIAMPVHALPTLAADRPCCIGDCDGDNQVTVNELVVQIDIALGTAEINACPNSCPCSSDLCGILWFTRSINNALYGCPQ